MHVRPPRPSGLLRPCARDWGGHEARLGSRVGRVGRYERAAAPHMRVGPRGRALSRVQRPSQWRAARAGGADVTPTHGHGPGSFAFFFRDPRHIAPLNYRLAEASANRLCNMILHEVPASDFAFHRRQLLVPSSHRADREVVRGSCWSSQEGGRLMRHRLTATRCLQARLTARRTLGHARVTPLDALGLQNSCLRRPLSSHGASEHLTQLRATDGKDLGGICSLGRSRRISGRLSAPHIRMIITCSPHLRWKVCLRQISRTTNGIQRAAAEVMITTPTLAAPSTRRLARRRAAVTCVMRTAMTRPTSTVALATTRHSTRREVTGGDRTSGEAGGRRSSGRACMRTRGFREFAGFSSALKKMVVCRRRCAASLADPNMEPITFFGGRPRQKNARARLCVPPQAQPSQAQSRARASSAVLRTK